MKKTKGYVRSQKRKQWVSGRIIVGIDPAKEKHQAVVLDGQGMQKGNPYSFEKGTTERYGNTLAAMDRTSHTGQAIYTRSSC